LPPAYPVPAQQQGISVTGSWSEDGGDEDIACADFIEAVLKGQEPEEKLYVTRVMQSVAARKFLDPVEDAFPLADLEFASAIDEFNFPMVVERRDEMILLKPGVINKS